MLIEVKGVRSMTEKWYPEKVMVGPEGTPATYNFMASVFHKEKHFAYAEFGFYRADTARISAKDFLIALYIFLTFLRILIMLRKNCRYLLIRFITTETRRSTTIHTTGA